MTAAALAIALLLFSIARPPNRHSGSVGLLDTTQYHNSTYGFSFSYPAFLDLVTYSPEAISIGWMHEDGFESEAEIRIELSIDSDPELPDTFEDFLFHRSRMACAADGPEEYLTCTDVEMLQPFETERGLRGSVFFLRHERVRTATGEVLQRDDRGPFIAFDISQRVPGHRFAVLLVHSPIMMEPMAIDAMLIREIALSLEMEEAPREKIIASA